MKEISIRLREFAEDWANTPVDTDVDIRRLNVNLFLDKLMRIIDDGYMSKELVNQEVERRIKERMENQNTYADGYVDGYFDSGKKLPPSITLDEADVLVQQTDYVIEATHQDINPINLGDASAFFIEGYEYCRSRLTNPGEQKTEGGE